MEAEGGIKLALFLQSSTVICTDHRRWVSMPVKPLHTLLNLLSLNVALKTFLIIMCLLCVWSSNVHGMRGCLGSAPWISGRAKGDLSEFFTVSQALSRVPRGFVDPPSSLETLKTKTDKALSRYNFRPVSTFVENCNGDLDCCEGDCTGVEAPK